MKTKQRKLIITTLMLLAALSVCLDVTARIRPYGYSFSYYKMLRGSVPSNSKKEFYPVDRRNLVGVSGGIAAYYGDLSPELSILSTDLSSLKPAFGIFYARRLGHRYTLKAEFVYATIASSDRVSANKNDTESGMYRYERGLSFRNRIKELSVVIMGDLFKASKYYAKRRVWNPYIFAGIGLFAHNPQAKAPDVDLLGNPLSEAGTWVDLKPLGTEGQYSNLHPGDANFGIMPYSYFQMAIPLGIGVRLKLTPVLDIWIDASVRFTLTDYLDDVSRSYVDLGALNSPLARAMSYRAPTTEDPDKLMSYVARNGKSYTVTKGRGAEGKDNMRGRSDNVDVYAIVGIRLTYALQRTFSRNVKIFQ